MPEDYRVELAQSAKRELSDLRNPILKRTIVALQSLASEPRPRGCRKLSGYQSKYRIRAGDYRIIYEVDDRERRVMIMRIRHRRDVYD